tara:strand:- start:1446 stop:1703 length:258 start_codon:yes stop_codon:yes gene_type:complete
MVRVSIFLLTIGIGMMIIGHMQNSQKVIYRYRPPTLDDYMSQTKFTPEMYDEMFNIENRYSMWHKAKADKLLNSGEIYLQNIAEN